jgi:hypothetical protein
MREPDRLTLPLCFRQVYLLSTIAADIVKIREE